MGVWHGFFGSQQLQLLSERDAKVGEPQVSAVNLEKYPTNPQNGHSRKHEQRTAAVSRYSTEHSSKKMAFRR